MESKTHWKKLHNPDFLGCYSLEPGQDLIATIDYVKMGDVFSPDKNKKEQKSILYFKERSIKPMVLNATNAKTITKLYDTPYIEEWHDRKIQIYADKFKAFGEMTEGLRIRKTMPKGASNYETALKQELKCADCGELITGTDKTTPEKIAEITKGKYGRIICITCGEKMKGAAEHASNANGD